MAAENHVTGAARWESGSNTLPLLFIPDDLHLPNGVSDTLVSSALDQYEFIYEEEKKEIWWINTVRILICLNEFSACGETKICVEFNLQVVGCFPRGLFRVNQWTQFWENITRCSQNTKMERRETLVSPEQPRCRNSGKKMYVLLLPTSVNQR